MLSEIESGAEIRITKGALGKIQTNNYLMKTKILNFSIYERCEINMQ